VQDVQLQEVQVPQAVSTPCSSHCLVSKCDWCVCLTLERENLETTEGEQATWVFSTLLVACLCLCLGCNCHFDPGLIEFDICDETAADILATLDLVA
jgi:hypothetical protein